MCASRRLKFPAIANRTCCSSLLGERDRAAVLVFARTKRGTEKLARNLTREGFAAAMIHGDRSQSQRTAALTGFQQGRYRVLVATDVASRGIHVQDIAHVINYDLPEIAENFIHRVGRTGRAGKSGVASTLFGREQRSELLQLERTLGIRMERMQADGSKFPERPGTHHPVDASLPVSVRIGGRSRGWFAFPAKSWKFSWKTNFNHRLPEDCESEQSFGKQFRLTR